MNVSEPAPPVIVPLAPPVVITSLPAPAFTFPVPVVIWSSAEPTVKSEWPTVYSTTAAAAVVAVAATACLPNCTKPLKSEAVEPVNVNAWLAPNAA